VGGSDDEAAWHQPVPGKSASIVDARPFGSDAMPRNRFCGSFGRGHLMRWIQGKKSHADGHMIINVKRCARRTSPAPTDQGRHYYVLSDDPVAALNILREAAGWAPWPLRTHPPRDDLPMPYVRKYTSSSSPLPASAASTRRRTPPTRS
jgi:hypothetical protein